MNLLKNLINLEKIDFTQSHQNIDSHSDQITKIYKIYNQYLFGSKHGEGC